MGLGAQGLRAYGMNVPAGTFVPLREQKRVLHTNSARPQRFHLAFEI